MATCICEPTLWLQWVNALKLWYKACFTIKMPITFLVIGIFLFRPQEKGGCDYRKRQGVTDSGSVSMKGGSLHTV
jgi:hypothetical protein